MDHKGKGDGYFQSLLAVVHPLHTHERLGVTSSVFIIQVNSSTYSLVLNSMTIRPHALSYLPLYFSNTNRVGTVTIFCFQTAKMLNDLSKVRIPVTREVRIQLIFVAPKTISLNYHNNMS